MKHPGNFLEGPGSFLEPSGSLLWIGPGQRTYDITARLRFFGLTVSPGKSQARRYTPLSESRYGLGRFLEDLGPMLAILGVIASTK